MYVIVSVRPGLLNQQLCLQMLKLRLDSSRLRWDTPKSEGVAWQSFRQLDAHAHLGLMRCPVGGEVGRNATVT